MSDSDRTPSNSHRQNDSEDSAEFHCHLCKSSFHSEVQLKMHHRRQHGESVAIRKSSTPSRKFRCEFCSKCFLTLRAMKVHIGLGHREHSERRIRELDEHFKCPSCDYRSERSFSMHNHIATHHADLINYSLTEITVYKDSNDSSDDVQNAENSLATENNEEQPSLEFLRADLANIEEELRKLRETKTTDRPPYCDVCGQVFKTLLDVEEHKETCNGGDTEENEIPDANNSFEPTQQEPPVKRARLEEPTEESNGEVADNEVNSDIVPMKTHISAKKEPNNSQAVISPVKDTMRDTVMKSEPKPGDKMRRNLSTTPTIGTSLDEGGTLNSFSGKNDEDSLAASSIEDERGNLELSSLTLLVGMFKRATGNPNELVAVWCPTLEEDVLITASENPANTIIILEGYSPLSLTQDGKEIWKKCQKAVFSMESDDGIMTSWTAIFFGDQRPPKDLHGNVFESFQDVELVLAEYAASRDMNLVNIMKFGTEGMFPSLSICFAKKTIGYDHHH